jgi:hypothetical protein
VRSYGCEKGSELVCRPDSPWLLDQTLGPLGSLDRVDRDQLVDEHGIGERLAQNGVSPHDCRDPQRLAALAATGQEIPVQLGDPGRAYCLEPQTADGCARKVLAHRGGQLPAGRVFLERRIMGSMNHSQAARMATAAAVMRGSGPPKR